ncbi:hypothetical protein GEV27_06740 [Aeromicrobium sp. S22]|uniref:hypothetical protein n=1 Tax=Aeromicrobium sp. S22 TaxID=2662029 RepID=UPI00129EF78D|nr:hypothetical protein [Aeromicrobium sp. S22]MRK01216.1 hypothetical protein [Aeromicrobium sp. S22]
MSTTGTRWGSVATVMVAAPWLAEMSWGGIPFAEVLLVIAFLGPMYGGAALLIRELARRTGRGWPTVLLLAVAFGVFQAGVVDQSLFNPAYGRYDFQHPLHVEIIDISLYYLLAFVSGHVVMSITMPIVLAEAWSRHPTAPWLTRRGLVVVAVLYVLATAVNHVGVKDEDGGGFQASPLQAGTALLTVGLLVVAACAWSRRTTTATRVPPRPVLAALGFLAYLFYLPGESAAAFASGIVVVTGTCLAVGRWSRAAGWTDDHVFWLALGALLTGAVLPYWAEPYDVGVSSAREALDDTVAALVCVTGAGLTLWRRRSGQRLRAGP